MTDTARITALEETVALLLAEREILRTISQYGHAIDSGDEGAWLDCFTEDGIFDVRRRALSGAGQAKLPVRCVGRAELAGFAAAHSRPPARYHIHTVGSPHITVTDQQARVDSKFVRLDADADGAPVVASFGLYRDRFVRCADGRWRLMERIAEVQARAGDPAAAIRR